MITAMKHFVPLLCSVPDKVDVDYEPPNGTTKIYIVPVLRAARRAGMQLVYIYDDIRLVADENMIVHKIFHQWGSLIKVPRFSHANRA